MEILHAADSKFFQLCFQSHAKTTRDSYYIECGKLKLNHIIAKRRLMFWHSILKRKTSDLVHKVYQIMKLKPCRNDWIFMIENDKVTYQITYSDSEISQMSKLQFKNYIELNINKKFFSELSESSKSKVENVKKTMIIDKRFKIQMQPYLKSNELSTKQKQALFSLRNRTYNLKCNYRTMYEDDMRCRSCLNDDSIEDEVHVFEECSNREEMQTNNNVKFKDIFGTLKQQIIAIKQFFPIMTKRDILLDVQKGS